MHLFIKSRMLVRTFWADINRRICLSIQEILFSIAIEVEEAISRIKSKKNNSAWSHCNRSLENHTIPWVVFQLHQSICLPVGLKTQYMFRQTGRHHQFNFGLEGRWGRGWPVSFFIDYLNTSNWQGTWIPLTPANFELLGHHLQDRGWQALR